MMPFAPGVAALLALVTAGTGAHGDWTRVELEGRRCAFDTPYRFFHHDGGDPSRLLVYFQGGGACWEWVSCSGMFDSSVADDEVAGLGGIFDFENPANPFAEYSIVFIPYCTGDVHMGDTTARYGDESWDVSPVHHHGFRNASAVVDWVEQHSVAPAQLVVAGASAGSYGALFHAPGIALRFPSARMILIGDSGVPLLHEYPDILERWGAGGVLRRLWYPDRRPDHGPVRLGLEAAHEHFARLRPDASLTQITTDRDAVQGAFYTFSGSSEWRSETLRLLRRLEDGISSFRAFVVAGGDHGLMRTDRFYEYEAGGVRLRDWIADLLAGEPVFSQYCERCRR